MWARQISPATGKIYKLTQLSDLAGNYVAPGAGITVAGGGTALYLKNEHGVVIKLLSTGVGLKFKLSADGQGGGAGWRPAHEAHDYAVMPAKRRVLNAKITSSTPNTTA